MQKFHAWAIQKSEITITVTSATTRSLWEYVKRVSTSITKSINKKNGLSYL